MKVLKLILELLMLPFFLLGMIASIPVMVLWNLYVALLKRLK